MAKPLVYATCAYVLLFLVLAVNLFVLLITSITVPQLEFKQRHTLPGGEQAARAQNLTKRKATVKKLARLEQKWNREHRVMM